MVFEPEIVVAPQSEIKYGRAVNDQFFITCAIPYVNAQVHIGNVLEYVIADAVARARRLAGQPVHFLVGTDEHGQKIKEAAEKEGLTPQAFVDQNAEYFQSVLRDLNISNDDYIRTTDQRRHWPVVQALWRRIEAAGDLYKKEYEGLYCVGCESFKTKSDLDEQGFCPLHNKAPEVVLEENWFFRLSKYQDQLKDFVRQSVVPEWRQQEVLNFIDQGLTDISFSRPKGKLDWGIPVPGDDDQVIYVWCDALTNYLSAVAQADGDQINSDVWPADAHVIGKDIVKFHAIYWPAMLLSAGLALPKKVVVHGFISIDHQKISKSLGNVILPHELIAEVGADALRYYYLKEIPTTDDGDFSRERLRELYTSDLANTIGNLFQRTLVMADKYAVEWTAPEDWSIDQQVYDLIVNYDLKAGAEIVLERAAAVNKAIQDAQPWALYKTNPDRTRSLLSGWLDELVIIAATLEPFMPTTAAELKRQLVERDPKPIFPPLS